MTFDFPTFELPTLHPSSFPMRLPLLILATAFAAVPASAQQTGFPAKPSGLTAETWTGLTPGKSVLILRKEGISSRAPNTTRVVSSATVTGLPVNSGTRLRGTLTPAVDDTYTFSARLQPARLRRQRRRPHP